MQEYEIVLTYLNGCAGEAHPVTSIEETEIPDPETYLRNKHGKDFRCFVKEGENCWRFDNGCVVYIYEFHALC